MNLSAIRATNALLHGMACDAANRADACDRAVVMLDEQRAALIGSFDQRIERVIAVAGRLAVERDALIAEYAERRARILAMAEQGRADADELSRAAACDEPEPPSRSGQSSEPSAPGQSHEAGADAPPAIIVNDPNYRPQAA